MEYTESGKNNLIKFLFYKNFLATFVDVNKLYQRRQSLKRKEIFKFSSKVFDSVLQQCFFS